MKTNWTTYTAGIAKSVRNSCVAVATSLISPAHSAVRGTSPAVRITLAGILIMSVACTSRQEAGEYHYMSPEDEQATVLMTDDEQGKAAVVALKDMMVDMHGFGTTDSYAEPQTLSSTALPSISSSQESGIPMFGAAGDAPIDEPAEATVAVVVPGPVTSTAQSKTSISLSATSGSSNAQSQIQLVSAMNIIASMASGASAQPVVASLSQGTISVPAQANRPAPTPVSTSQPTITAPTPTPVPVTPDTTNSELAQALKDILNVPPTVTPTAAPSNEKNGKSKSSGSGKFEKSKKSSKGYKTDDAAEDVTPVPTIEPTPVPTVEPTVESTPGPVLSADDQKHDKDDKEKDADKG
jgi:hypothetical protein